MVSESILFQNVELEKRKPPDTNAQTNICIALEKKNLKSMGVEIEMTDMHIDQKVHYVKHTNSSFD
jgi:hypothetical protein